LFQAILNAKLVGQIFAYTDSTVGFLNGNKFYILLYASFEKIVSIAVLISDEPGYD
jgi:uncharacterized protein YlzI (FlbEa/FlbD family)